MLQLSDAYELAHLKQLTECTISAWDVLSVDNVCELCTHAHACNAPQLLSVCVAAMSGMYRVVSAMPSWSLVPPDVVAQIELEAGVKR